MNESCFHRFSNLNPSWSEMLKASPDLLAKNAPVPNWVIVVKNKNCFFVTLIATPSGVARD